MAIFNSPQNPHPLTDYQKFCTGDCVSDPHGCAILGANLPMGLLGKLVKYNKFFKFIYLYLFGGNSYTGQTHQQIFTLDG